MRTRYILSEPIQRLLLAKYDGKTETIDELERLTGLPRWKIRNWARSQGLARTKEPNWSEAEETYLEQHLTKHSLTQIAHHLGRSKVAVKLKAKRLGIRKQAEGYTLCGLCLAFGCDHHTIEKWIRAGWLKGTRRQTERTVEQGDTWYFSDAAVRRLITEHPLEIDPRKADWLWLVDILSGGLGNLEGK